MPLRFSDAATSTLTVSITTSTTNLAVESVASFPQGMVAGDFFIAVIANTENTVRETIKVTAINYLDKSLTVVRGYDNTTPIAWPLGSKIEIRGGSALFKEVINSVVTAPASASNNQLLRFDQAANKAKATTITVDDSGNLVCLAKITTNDISTTLGLSVNTRSVIDLNGNVTFNGVPTVNNESRGIFWTAYDKEGTTDFSDTAHIRHTINSGGLTGSVLEISSLNDIADGVNIIVPSANNARINGNSIWNNGNATTSFSTNGYVTFPNGLIMQWCTGGSLGSETDITVTFPIAFPNVCLHVMPASQMPDGSRDSMFQLRSFNNSSCLLRLNSFNNAGGVGLPLVWAIGY
jgi:hypothetical protein